jgi:hypothetical protein
MTFFGILKKNHNPRGSLNITYDLGNNKIHGVVMNINYDH